MLLVRSLFIFAVVSAFATAKAQQLEDPNFYPYKNYLEPKQDQRQQQMMTFSFIIPVMPTRRTTVEWTTSTSTIVCTKYTDAPCSVRTSVMEETVRPTRRPARPGRPSAVSTLAPIDTSVIIIDEGKEIMTNENFDDQFSIFPSVVQRVESTKLPRFPVREARAADPQYLLMYRNQPQDIEPGFQSGPFKPVVMPNRRRPTINLQRQFLQNYWSVTRRSTIREIFVSTSTPVCSSIGSIPQCAIVEDLRCDK